MRFIGFVAASLATVFAGQAAAAGIYSDELGKCLVSSTTHQDQLDLVSWIFSAFAVNPNVQQYVNIPESQRQAIDHTTGLLVIRLLTKDCRTQTVSALKYEGAGSLEPAFSLLGQVAARGLMSDPAVAERISSLGSDLDKSALEILFQEAGIRE